jgi:uncharacterized DUF497 family protein
MDFDWDPGKARINLAEHKVDFNEAKLVFKDPFAIDLDDDREDYGEERRTILGRVGTRVLFVAYTMRDENTVRLISARKATRRERHAYHEEQR